MTSDLDELTRVVGTMPREMAREVLNFARYLQRKLDHPTDTAPDWDEDFGSRYGDGGFGGYTRGTRPTRRPRPATWRSFSDKSMGHIRLTGTYVSHDRPTR